MARWTAKFAYGRWWTPDEYEALRARYEAEKASRPSTPYIIRDTCDAFQSMADGQFYDSKARYRADLKARGLIEVGDDPSVSQPPKEFEPTNVQQSVLDAWDQIEAGHIPPPLETAGI